MLTYVLYTLAGLANLAVGWFSVYLTAVICYTLNPGHRMVQALIRVHQEMWPVAGPGLIAAIMVYAAELAASGWAGGLHPWGVLFNTLGIVANTVIYWTWRRARDWPDENPWKRRGRRIRGAVKALGRRLTVVPA